MREMIHNELIEVVSDWKDGNPIRAIVIGHAHRQDPKTREHVRFDFDLQRAYEYVFDLVGRGLELEILDYELFCSLKEHNRPGLNLEERNAAESLAWKVLVNGWQRTLEQFPADTRITLTRKADA